MNTRVHTRIPYGPCDTTLFCDSDGTFYVVMPKGEIYIQKVDLSGLAQGVIDRVGEEKRIVTKSNEDIGLAVSTTYLEGPWLEHMGRQYLFDPKTRQWKAGAMDCFFWAG